MDSHDSVWASAHLLQRLDSQFRSFLLFDPSHMFFDGLIFQPEAFSGYSGTRTA